MTKKPKPLSSKPNTAQDPKKNFKVNPILRQQPRGQADRKYIQALADEIVRWARTPKVLTIEMFYDFLYVPTSTVEDWARKHKDLKEAFNRAKIIIGARREEGLIENKYNNYIARTLHNYLPRCKKDDQWHAELKAKAAENDKKVGTINVTIPNMPTSNQVPPKKKDKDE